METKILLTKDFLRTINSTVLAHSLKKHIWGKLDSGSFRSDLLEEAIKRLNADAVCITDNEYLENIEWASRSYKAAVHGKSVPCRGCENEFALINLFRCFHCGSYFCPNCAKEHFGLRPGQISGEGRDK